MSATFPNLDKIANWLGAICYETDFRPVAIEEFVKAGSKVIDSNSQTVREIGPPQYKKVLGDWSGFFPLI